MEIKISVPFNCPANIKPFLEKVFKGEYDVPIHLPNMARIVDLGANYGAFAMWAVHRWPSCNVQCYEPHPDVFKVLEHNVRPYPQIEVFNWGIGTPGMRVLNDGPNNDGERSFHSIMNVKCPTGRHCEVRDPLSLPECDVLKLDIEGCEMEVLEPLIDAQRKPQLILLEYHNHQLRRRVDHLLCDYEMIGGETTTPFGLGVAKYLRGDIMQEVMNAVIR